MSRAFWIAGDLVFYGAVPALAALFIAFVAAFIFRNRTAAAVITVLIGIDTIAAVAIIAVGIALDMTAAPR